MKLVETDVLPSLDDFTQQLVYCGLDSAITQEIYHVLAEEMDEVAHAAYGLSKSFIPVAETMMARGVLVDAKVRDEQAEIISFKIRQLQCCLDFLAEGVWEQGLNPNSPKQLQEFFYEHLFLPKQIASKKGESRVSTDRDTLERLAKNYSRAAPFSNLILAIRDYKKTLDTLTTGLDENGRWRCNWNLGGTETGRWSSSAHPFRFGGNLQNITEDLRCVFVPDPDFIMFSCDQQGAEARAVAYYSGDEAYIKAVESGDIHTAVASMVWGFEAKRELSDRKFYRDFSYRDMSKKYTHGSSYGGQARTLAIQAKTEIKMAEDFQYKFFKAFPGIRRWQEWVAREIQTRGELTTCFGLRRIFWGRPWDDATVREAIAFLPQSTVGQLTAICMRTIWERMEPEVQLLANGHDAIIGQIPKKKLDILMPRLLECLNHPIQVKDINGIVRTMTIPWEMSVGENWGKFDSRNPHGLKKVD